MKTQFFLFLLIVSFSVRVEAQQIPNSGFESWTNIGGWFDNPDEWQTGNNQIQTPVVKDTLAHPGNYALQINAMGINSFAKTKFAISAHPNQLNFFVKTNVAGSEEVSIVSKLFYSNNVVDSAQWTYSSPLLNWTPIGIPFSQSSILVDSVEIQIANAGINSTYISVDDMTFITTNIKENLIEVLSEVYPNPAKDFVTIEFENRNQNNFTLSLFSVDGKLLKSINIVQADKYILDTKEFPAGEYFFNLNCKNYWGRGRFSKY